MARWRAPVSLALALAGVTLSFVGCSRQPTPAANPTDDGAGVRRDVDPPSPPTRTPTPVPTAAPTAEPPTAAPPTPTPAVTEPPATDAVGSPAAQPSTSAEPSASPAATPTPVGFPPYDYPGARTPPPAGGGGGLFVPRFVEDVVPILREKCATCHVTGGPGAFAMFDAAGTPQYQVIHDHMGAMLSAIDAKRMPPNGTTVSAAQVAMLRAWQAVGAPPEPTATPTPPPPGQPLPSALPTGTPVPGLQTISFNQHVVPILQNHCANCHGFGGSGSGQLLMFGATRRAVHGQIAVRINDIISSIEAGRMPPLVAPGTVTTDEINTLKLWAAAGAPNN